MFPENYSSISRKNNLKIYIYIYIYIPEEIGVVVNNDFLSVFAELTMVFVNYD